METVSYWLDASGTNTWSYTHGGLTWTSGKSYTISSRSTDDAANDQNP